MATTLPETPTETTAPGATLRLEIVACSDVGQVRELNEDTVWAAPLAPGPENAWQLSGLLLVADGMGGHQAGEVASGLAGQTAREIFSAPRAAFAPEEIAGQQLLGRISDAVQHINRVVFARGESDGGAGGRPGTTLTLALLREGEWAIGHVGDSRAYLIRRSGIEQLTEDDSMVAEAVRRGQMTEEEAQNSQFRNQITKAIGLNSEVVPSTYQGSWAAGDVILLCSDGLTEYVASSEMLAAVNSGDSLQSVCEMLIEAANARGGHDNISVAAARFAPNLNGGAATKAVAGNGRKPATWPPTKRPDMAATNDPFVDENPGRTRKVASARKPSKRIWLATALVFALACAAVGVWIGTRATKPVATPATNSVEVKPPVAVAPVADSGEVTVDAPAVSPEPEATKVVELTDVLQISLSPTRSAFVIEAPKRTLTAQKANERNMVAMGGDKKATVKINKLKPTRDMLVSRDARLQVFEELGTGRKKLYAQEFTPGLIKINNPKIGNYILQMYYPATKREREHTTPLAYFQLSKPRK